MTVQAKDRFLFNNKFYYIVAVKDIASFFNPNLLGYELWPASTACYRGFSAEYKTALNQNLTITDLILSTKSDNIIEINGVKPIVIDIKNPSKEYFYIRMCGSLFYKNIYLDVDYTGNLLIAEGFKEITVKYLGKYDKDKYINPVELIFVNGILVNFLV